jgi:hypothetical protein
VVHESLASIDAGKAFVVLQKLASGYLVQRVRSLHVFQLAR